MKTLVLIVIFILYSSTSICQKIKTLDKKYGFRNATFEMPLDSFKDFVEVKKNVYISVYEDLTVGEVKLDSVYYVFINNLLYNIIIKTNGIYSQGFLKTLQKDFGKGNFNFGKDGLVLWEGKKVYMLYWENTVTHIATTAIFSRTMFKQLNKQGKLEMLKL